MELLEDGDERVPIKWQKQMKKKEEERTRVTEKCLNAIFDTKFIKWKNNNDVKYNYFPSFL